MLNSTIPVSQVDLLNDVMIVVSALVNLNKSVVSQWQQHVSNGQQHEQLFLLFLLKPFLI